MRKFVLTFTIILLLLILPFNNLYSQNINTNTNVLDFATLEAVNYKSNCDQGNINGTIINFENINSRISYTCTVAYKITTSLDLAYKVNLNIESNSLNDLLLTYRVADDNGYITNFLPIHEANVIYSSSEQDNMIYITYKVSKVTASSLKNNFSLKLNLTVSPVL